MMLIPCPFCGPRDQDEFVCRGQTSIARPGPAPEVDDRTWADYLYVRDIPRGRLYERWGHVQGCGEWFNLLRDTVSHQVLGPFAITEANPERIER